jgi:hypothetical protein
LLAALGSELFLRHKGCRLPSSRFQPDTGSQTGNVSRFIRKRGTCCPFFCPFHQVLCVFFYGNVIFLFGDAEKESRKQFVYEKSAFMGTNLTLSSPPGPIQP